MYRGNQVKAHEDLGKKTAIYKARREDSGKKKKKKHQLSENLDFRLTASGTLRKCISVV